MGIATIILFTGFVLFLFGVFVWLTYICVFCKHDDFFGLLLGPGPLPKEKPKGPKLPA